MAAHWAVAPQEPEQLCDQEAVLALTCHGQQRAAARGIGWCHWHHDYARGTRLIMVTGTTSRKTRRLKPRYLPGN